MNSNLTPQEQWRLHGTFTEETAQQLLDLDAAIKCADKGWATTGLNEARGCLPAEDVLTTHLRDLALLVKSCRGTNKDRAQDLFNELHQLAETMRQETEYARDQLDSTAKKLSALGL